MLPCADPLPHLICSPPIIIREDNAFRYDKDVLPYPEGAELWAAFNVEMDRLYSVMNEGKEPDLGD
jgi:hypothetical protein